jgi:hypothetical protein
MVAGVITALASGSRRGLALIVGDAERVAACCSFGPRRDEDATLGPVGRTTADAISINGSLDASGGLAIVSIDSRKAI